MEHKYQVAKPRRKKRFSEQPLRYRILGRIASVSIAIISIVVFAIPIVLAIYKGSAYNLLYLLGSGAIIWMIYRVAEAQLPEWMFNP